MIKIVFVFHRPTLIFVYSKQDDLNMTISAQLEFEKGDPVTAPPPTLLSPNMLFELISPPSHCFTVSLVPQFIATHFHYSPHHQPIPMVPHRIVSSTNWCSISQVSISLVHQLTIHHPFHWPPLRIGPPSHCSPYVTLVTQFSLMSHLNCPQCNPAHTG